MKYLDKDYNLKKSYIDCLDDYECLMENKDFETLYEESLQERIRKARISFDTPTKMIRTREETISSYHEKAYPKYDLVSKRIVGYLTLEEVLKSYDYQEAKLRQMFEKRGPFDEEKVKNLFRKNYENRLDSGFFEIPYKFRCQVDPRFLALGVIPKSVYDEIRKYCESCNAFVEEREKVEQLYFDSIKDKFTSLECDLKKKNFTPLVSILQNGNDIRFLFHFEGLRSQYSTGFSAYDFHNVSDLEKEDDIDIENSHERKTRYMEYMLIRNVELSYDDQKKKVSFLLEKKPYGEITTISFYFESADILKNI